MSRLSWTPASDLFEGRCGGHGAHGAAHGRAYRECVAQFPILPSGCIGEIEPTAEQGAGGIRGLSRFYQSQFRKELAVQADNASAADREINTSHHHDL